MIVIIAVFLSFLTTLARLLPTKSTVQAETSEPSQMLQARRLQLYNTTTESNICVSCIDKGNVFCPFANMQGGYCCKPDEQCPSVGMCTDVWNQALDKYRLCPNDPSCKFPKIITPNSTLVTYAFSPKSGESMFKLGDVCSYKIQMPPNADTNDLIYFRLEYLQYTQAYLTKGVALDDQVANYTLQAG